MAASSESMDELLQCPICLERFTNPKVLPCQHTFCLNCLRGITRGADTLACPQCRKEHRIPPNGVVELEDNLTIKSLLGWFAESSACFDCGRVLSLSRCQHCAREVCADCRASHTKLVAEIDFRMIEDTTGDNSNTVDSKLNCADQVIWNELLDRVVSEKKRVPEMFDELERKLEKRKESVRLFLEAMERRSRILVNEDKASNVRVMIDQLLACQTTAQLEKFKNLLESTEATLAAVLETGRGADFEISYDPKALTYFGNVICGDSSIDIGIADMDRRRSEGTSSQSFRSLDSGRKIRRSTSLRAGAESLELLERKRRLNNRTRQDSGDSNAKCGVLPSNVNYKAKNSTLKIYIDRHPESGKVLLPRYALYSTLTDSIFCLSGEPSKSQVLVYALDGSGGRDLSPLIRSANHLALSDSGKLIVAHDSAVTIVDLVASRNVGSKNAVVRLELQDGIGVASQVCCYLNEFVILDSQKKCLTIFNEKGQLVREIGVQQLHLGGQKMAVDQEGYIYIAGDSRVTNRQDSGEEKGCKHNRTLSSVTVESVMDIAVFTWDGEFWKRVELLCARQYDYKYDGASCCQTPGRKQNSVPTNETILKENSIRRFCLDSDGFICVTKANYHMIEVYDPKGQLDCTIGDANKGPAGFSNPSGVSLMPDGRLIVCDSGNKRIQIL